jgi:hypothetical protein
MPTITTVGTSMAGNARNVTRSRLRIGIGGSAGKFLRRA